MRRFAATVFALMLSLTLAHPAVALAPPAVSLTLQVDGLQSEQVTTGGTFVLQVSATAATDLYGSSVDIFYDATRLAPTADSQVTTAEGLVTGALGPSQFHTANLASSGSAAARQSLVALRLGNLPGVDGSGLIGKMEFTTLAEGDVSFTAGAAGTGNVTVKLVSSAGVPIPVVTSTPASVSIVSPQAAQPVTISSPQSGAYFASANVTVTGTAAPGANVTVTMDGSDSVTATADGDSEAFSASFSNLSEGLHTVTATAPNASPAGAVSFTVDTLSPVISIDPITSVTSPLLVTGSITEANLKAASVAVGSTKHPVTPDANGEFSVSLPLQAGANTIQFDAEDKAGNTAATVPQTVTFAAPQLQLTPDQEYYFPGSTVVLAATLLNPPPNLMGITAQFSFDPSVLELPASAGAGLSTAGSILEGGETASATIVPYTSSVGVTLSRAAGPVTGRTLAFTYTMNVRSDAYPTVSQIYVDSVTLTDLASEPIPAETPVGASIQIKDEGIIAGQILAGGRADASGIIVRVEGTELMDTTDSSGNFSISQVPAGYYTLGFSRKSFLTLELYGVPVTANQTTAVSGLTLHPGNIVDNSESQDTAFLEDLGAMAYVWNQAVSTSEPLSAAADLSGNGQVDLADLALLGQVWGKAGAASYYPDEGFLVDYSSLSNPDGEPAK